MSDTRHLPARALLLDMDGVLVDSTGQVEAHWTRWAERRGLDPAKVLRFAHGSPCRDVVARFVASHEVAVEAAWVENLAMEPCEEVALPGADRLLKQQGLSVAVVTSATSAVARLRLARAGLNVPHVLVGAYDVERGKPDPQPYLRAAHLLGVDPRDCVGIEDTPAGVAAIRASGATPLAVLTTHSADQLCDAVALIADLSALAVDSTGLSW